MSHNNPSHTVILGASDTHGTAISAGPDQNCTNTKLLSTIKNLIRP